MPVEVEVFDAKFQTLLQPQPGAIEQRHDEPHRALEMREDLIHLFAAEDNRNAMRQPGPGHLFDPAYLYAEYMPIEEQHGAQCLILRRGADASRGRQPRQEGRDLRRCHRRRMLLVLKEDESSNPVCVGGLGSPSARL